MYADDLAGNLWRFNIASSDPRNWTVDLMFTTYGNGGAARRATSPSCSIRRRCAVRTQTRGPIVFRDRQITWARTIARRRYQSRPSMASRLHRARWGTLSHQRGAARPQTMGRASGGARAITGFVKPDNPPTSDVPLMQLKTQDSGKAVVKSVAANGWRIRLNEPTEGREGTAPASHSVADSPTWRFLRIDTEGDDPMRSGRALFDHDTRRRNGAGALEPRTGIDDGRGLVGSGPCRLPLRPAIRSLKRGGGGTA